MCIFYIFQQACLAESQHCNSKKEDVCHAYLAYTHLCESGGLDPAVAELPGKLITVFFQL